MKEVDYPYFEELLTAPEIVDPIPQRPFPLRIVREKFESSLVETYRELPGQEKTSLAVCENGKEEVIGLCLLLQNDEGEREIGYRFRKKYWGRGFASETLKGMLRFCFTELNQKLVTADVSAHNKASVRVLEKYMYFSKEFYNDRDKCIDYRFKLKRSEWEVRAD